jgi:hypothetical protein
LAKNLLGNGTSVDSVTLAGVAATVTFFSDLIVQVRAGPSATAGPGRHRNHDKHGRHH